MTNLNQIREALSAVDGVESARVVKSGEGVLCSIAGGHSVSECLDCLKEIVGSMVFEFKPTVRGFNVWFKVGGMSKPVRSN